MNLQSIDQRAICNDTAALVKSNRRTFLKGATATALGATLGLTEEEPLNSKQQELQNLLEADGYDPTSPDGVVIALIADAHIFGGYEYPQYYADHYHDGLIEEINSLAPLVSELFIAGDLVSYHSISPGVPPYDRHRIWAEEEFDKAVVQVARFNHRVWMVPGNHDTTAYETDAQLFCEKMQVPSYQKTVFGGVPVFFLNSGNAGMLDPVQQVWFKSEVALIPQEQEVLIIAHIPPFFSTLTQAGHKRIITDIFQNHKANIWVASGHNHAFAEQKFIHNGVNYVQTQVTAASIYEPQVFGDRRNPGYTAIALQGGKIQSRIFRSLKDPGYQTRPPVSSMSSSKVKFVFDGIPFPMALYEEGFYDHADYSINFSGVHVGSYIAYCKTITMRIDPANYLGQIEQFIVAGRIQSGNIPTCSISETGENETWTSLTFPAADGSGLYAVTIPEIFRNKTFFVKLDTGLTLSVHGFSMSGWALVANETELTGYEKWLIHHYQSLEQNIQTHPNTLSPGKTHPNIINFGFNLMPIDGSNLSGLPEVAIASAVDSAEKHTSLTFVRMNENFNPGISYVIEYSNDLKVWSPVPDTGIEETILQTEGGWEKVKSNILQPLRNRQFYRVNLSHPQEWPS